MTVTSWLASFFVFVFSTSNLKDGFLRYADDGACKLKDGPDLLLLINSLLNYIYNLITTLDIIKPDPPGCMKINQAINEIVQVSLYYSVAQESHLTKIQLVILL